MFQVFGIKINDGMNEKPKLKIRLKFNIHKYKIDNYCIPALACALRQREIIKLILHDD